MTDKEKLEAIKAEIERRLEELNPKKGEWMGKPLRDVNPRTFPRESELEKLLAFIDALPEEPKFKVGDMVVSTKNPSLTYKVLKVGLTNELGKLDYEVEIFTDGKAGIKVGNTFEEHNIHLVSCEKMDEWGKLIPEEPVSDDLEEELDSYIKDNFTIDKEQLDRFGLDEKDYMYSMDKSDMLAMVRHFTELQHKKDVVIIEDLIATAFANGMADMKQQMMEKAVDTEVCHIFGNEDKAFFPMYGIDMEQGDKVKVIIIKEE